jgi:hypothetical protein
MAYAPSPSPIVSCRLCGTRIDSSATVCPSCGAKEPWIPDEPTLSPHVMRLLVWGGGIVLIGVLLLMSGVVMFGSADGERDHRPPHVESEAHDSR